MHVLARAMRGPAWLAWLSLLFAAQIAAADPVVGPDPDDGQDRPAAHAAARPRPLAIAIPGADAAGTADSRVRSTGPAVVTTAAPRPATPRSGAPRAQVCRLVSSRTSSRLHPRAPPFSAFL